MAYQYKNHYTLDEARALLPLARQWLLRLQAAMERFNQYEKRLRSLAQGGADLGGPTVNDWTRLMVEIAEVFAEFHSREILVKDLERGLVDFPSLKGDQEVFLCWEQDEEDIRFWHSLDSGFAGRAPLD
jgi:hypothetical protein